MAVELMRRQKNRRNGNAGPSAPETGEDMQAARTRSPGWMLVAGLLVAIPVANAATLDLPDKPLAYTVVDQDLPDLLREVGARLGVNVNVSDAVHGGVHGRQPRLTARAFLNRLGKVYGFSWYYDGTTLFFFADSEITSKLVDLGSVSPATLGDALADLEIADARWPLHSSPTAGLVVVQGPARYIELVQQTLAALQRKQRPGSDGTVEIRVFHGQPGGSA
jgi:type III secretion protein C